MRFCVWHAGDVKRWAAGAVMVLLALGIFSGRLLTAREEEAVAAFAASAPTESQDGFTIDVLSASFRETPARVLIYHTHTFEAYQPTEQYAYQQTEKWRTRDSERNVVRVGKELAALLRAAGIEVTHVTEAFEPPLLSTAYARSLEMLEEKLSAGERYDLYIDLHRDAYSAGIPGGQTASAGDTQLARLMVLIGKGTGQTGAGFTDRPAWENNLAVARLLTDSLNRQADGLCREIAVKSGRYNQHVAPNCVLIEAGNNRNTLEEALASMPYLAHAICEFFDNLPLAPETESK